jgi:hypothetical protein
VKRPLFILSVALGALLLAWAAMFRDLLYSQEQVFLVVGVLAVVGAASRVGTLVVHSLSLRGGDLEDAIVWDIATVRAVRAAIELAMRRRAVLSSPTSTAKGGSADD